MCSSLGQRRAAGEQACTPKLLTCLSHASQTLRRISAASSKTCQTPRPMLCLIFAPLALLHAVHSRSPDDADVRTPSARIYGPAAIGIRGSDTSIEPPYRPWLACLP